MIIRKTSKHLNIGQQGERIAETYVDWLTGGSTNVDPLLNRDLCLGYESNWKNLNTICNHEKDGSPRKKESKKIVRYKGNSVASFTLQRFWSSTNKLSANIGYPLLISATVLNQQEDIGLDPPVLKTKKQLQAIKTVFNHDIVQCMNKLSFNVFWRPSICEISKLRWKKIFFWHLAIAIFKRTEGQTDERTDRGHSIGPTSRVVGSNKTQRKTSTTSGMA